jgi:P27 family predicted phage terminase small subunit
MGKRGPQPTPTEILDDRGSWLAKERSGEVKHESGIPDCPEWLDQEARAEWDRQIRGMATGILSSTDRGFLAAYCAAWSEFKVAQQFIYEHGHTAVTDKGNEIQHPMVGVRNKAAERMNRFGSHFGFSPSSRVGIPAPAHTPEKGNGKLRFFAG